MRQLKGQDTTFLHSGTMPVGERAHSGVKTLEVLALLPVLTFVTTVTSFSEGYLSLLLYKVRRLTCMSSDFYFL